MKVFLCLHVKHPNHKLRPQSSPKTPLHVKYFSHKMGFHVAVSLFLFGIAKIKKYSV